MIALAAAETEVRGNLWQPQLADQGTIWVITMKTVMSRSPETTEMIKSDAVVTLVVGTEELTAGQRSMINIEDSDVVLLAVDDEQTAFIGENARPLGWAKSSTTAVRFPLSGSRR